MVSCTWGCASYKVIKSNPTPWPEHYIKYKAPGRYIVTDHHHSGGRRWSWRWRRCRRCRAIGVWSGVSHDQHPKWFARFNSWGVPRFPRQPPISIYIGNWWTLEGTAPSQARSLNNRCIGFKCSERLIVSSGAEYEGVQN